MPPLIVRTSLSVPIEITEFGDVSVRLSKPKQKKFPMPIVFVDEVMNGVNSFDTMMREFGLYGCQCLTVLRTDFEEFIWSYREGRFLVAGLYKPGLPLSPIILEYSSRILGYILLIQEPEWKLTETVRAMINSEIDTAGFKNFPVLPQSKVCTVDKVTRWIVENFSGEFSRSH